MRVVYFADVRFPIERANGIQTIETVHALARRDHRVTLVCRPDTESPARDPCAYYGLHPLPTLTITRTPVWGTAPMRRVEYLLAAAGWSLGRLATDIVMTRDLGVASLLVRLPRLARPAVVYESHGFAPTVAGELATLLGTTMQPSERKRRRLLARERHVWRRAEGYATLTSGLLDELTQRFGQRPRVSVVPDGTRLDSGASRPVPTSASTRASLVAYAGHLYPWKGVDVLVQALAQLPRARGLIIGGHSRDNDLARVRALAQQLGVAERIDFTGQVAPADVRARLAAADVLVLPNVPSEISARYTSPLKLFEYLALAKPIVASDLPALREILTPEVTALLVEPGSATALAAGLSRVLDAPHLASTLGANAGRLATEYSWDKRAERLEALFMSARSLDA